MAKRPDEEQLISSTPRQAVVFFPYINHYDGVTRGNLMKTREINATSSVYNLSYGNAKSGPSGIFSITLGPDKDWTRILRPGDWVMIYQSQFGIDTNGTKGLRCLGNIDRVSRQKIISNDGTKRFTYRVVGRDFGKIFEKTKFYYNPYIPKEVQQNFVFLKSGIKVTGSPASFVKTYVDLYLGSGTLIKDQIAKRKNPSDKVVVEKLEKMDQLRLPDAIYKKFGEDKKINRFADILKVEIGGFEDGSLNPEGYSWAIPPDRVVSGSLWDIIMSVSNPLMNELFLSMKFYPAENKVFPTLTLRKLPYRGHKTHKTGKPLFPRLSALTIQENMIISDDLGFNDHEIYNFINFDPQIPRISGYAQFMAASKATRRDDFAKADVRLFPFINQASIARNGLNTLEQTSEFVMIERGRDKEGKEKLDIQLAERWMKELIEWWEDYVRFESGTIVIKGFSEVNVFEEGKGKGVITINDRKLTANELQTARRILGKRDKVGIANDQFNLGDNIYLNSRDRLYQLEGYNIDWQAPGESTITLTVIRGVEGKPGTSTYKFIDEVRNFSETISEDELGQKDLSVTKVLREADPKSRRKK